MTSLRTTARAKKDSTEALNPKESPLGAAGAEGSSMMGTDPRARGSRYSRIAPCRSDEAQPPRKGSQRPSPKANAGKKVSVPKIVQQRVWRPFPGSYLGRKNIHAPKTPANTNPVPRLRSILMAHAAQPRNTDDEIDSSHISRSQQLVYQFVALRYGDLYKSKAPSVSSHSGSAWSPRLRPKRIHFSNSTATKAAPATPTMRSHDSTPRGAVWKSLFITGT